MKNSNVINLEERLVQKFEAQTSQIAAEIHNLFSFWLTSPNKYYNMGLSLIACGIHFIAHAHSSIPLEDRKQAIAFAHDFLEKAKKGIK